MLDVQVNSGKQYANQYAKVEGQLQLHGWGTKRRVVIVNQRIRGGIARKRRVDGKQRRLDLAGLSVREWDRLRESAVMVTDVVNPIEVIGQLCRDRADCENGIDELKNQWGMSRFTTQEINHCQTTARACTLTYNWWSLYCRAANPRARMEAITSRLLLLAVVGKAASLAGQTTLCLTPMLGKTSILTSLITNIRGLAACQGHCGAVRHGRSLGGADALRERQNRADTWAVQASRCPAGYGVIAGFRISSNC